MSTVLVAVYVDPPILPFYSLYKSLHSNPGPETHLDSKLSKWYPDFYDISPYILAKLKGGYIIKIFLIITTHPGISSEYNL